MIMETTDILDDLQKKSAYWSNSNKTTFQMLKGLTIPFLLLMIVKISFMPNKISSDGAALSNVATSAAYMAVIVIYCLVTVRVLKRQLQIFTLDNNGNLKEKLTNTIIDFKKFYVTFNLTYLFLYPIFYYAVIKLMIINGATSLDNTLLICGLLTIASLALGHLYYKIQYLSKIKLLEAHLKQLEEDGYNFPNTL
ncbi:hypothetical protein N180_09850 [Pedobacter antarcticus 4BY]|uniref:Uncharacterized protein n=3 Tax=Pedobacter antarcticus TaxID=34086 RepID=A0A081PEL5_9SPHI|nr:hypothetical protein N180_09850 [Pedobacter antarcticus 4BY]SFE94965.1 hypothetical protein SAMN03003324_01942 [Pedobacter antarcticus]